MSIRLLDTATINRIAAGEVVERPASAVKELVENAIDAGSTQIDVSIRDGGQSLIIVSDNGSGMSLEDLKLCIERHATSKLPDNDLTHIYTMGFRGEALPSIGSVSRLNISTVNRESGDSWEIRVEGGKVHDPIPGNFFKGTRVEVCDLFYATPARLKFLRSPKTEQGHIVDNIQRLALAHHAIGFTLKDEKKEVLNYHPVNHAIDRIGDIVGKDFAANAIPIEGGKEYLKLTGFVGLPTLSRSSNQHQYLFVNGRVVHDKFFASAIRAAYSDLVSKDKYPMLVLSLELPPDYLDVNVHPAKTEVRFQDLQLVRSLIVGTIRHHLTQASHLTSTTIHRKASEALQPFMPPQFTPPFMKSETYISHPASLRTKSVYQTSKSKPTLEYVNTTQKYTDLMGGIEEELNFFTNDAQGFFGSTKGKDRAEEDSNVVSIFPMDVGPFIETRKAGYLGHAIAQIYDTYILSQKEDELILTDQHAAHERLVYEQMKEQLHDQGVHRQALMVPAIVELSEERREKVLSFADTLKRYGVLIEAFGSYELAIHEVPALFKEADLTEIMMDIADLAEEDSPVDVIKEKLFEVLASRACHGSVRSGQSLTVPEMNALLRDMENTPFSGQCNHGRPTYVKLSKKDIETFFGRR